MATRLHLPFAWAIHESWKPEDYWRVIYPKGFLDPDVRDRAEIALGEATALVFEAEATRQLFLDYISPERALVVPYGVRVSAIEQFMTKSPRAAVRRRLGFRPDERVLLVMGTIEPRKAQTVIAQAFARIADSHPDATLVLVGDMKTRYSEALRELTEGLGIADRVRIVPIVKDTYSWYRAADALLCASDIESLPRSVLEAMCFGVPILATSVFGLSELLKDGVNGFLYEARDVGFAASALHRLLSLPPEEVREVGLAGRADVTTSYDSIGYATEITAMLADAIAAST
jgi:glycosyltransferase involved in cell wall biosynthesis